MPQAEMSKLTNLFELVNSYVDIKKYKSSLKLKTTFIL